MKKLLLSFIGLTSLYVTAQTTVYTTGQTYTDAWTGWSTPVTTNVTSSSVNGVNIYNFSGTASTSFTAEIYRQFTINSNDLDIYLSATTQNCTISVEYSTDNVSYTQIGSQVWGPGLAVSTLVIPTFDPTVSTFYLKLKMNGTFGSPSQSSFNNLKIDAVLNTSAVEEFSLGSNVIFSNGILQVNSSSQNYNVAIYNLSGQKIISENNAKMFDLTAQENGIYFVTYTSGDFRKTIKIVKSL